jgi:hypothetical protein
MKSSHRGLGITLPEWEIFLQHLVASFDALGVADREQADVIAASESLKWDIVEAPSSAAAE